MQPLSLVEEGGNVDLQLNLLNLTDETIYDASHVGLFATVAPGRSAELTFNLRF